MSTALSQRLYQSFSTTIIPTGGIVWAAGLVVKVTRTPNSVKVSIPRMSFTAAAADTEVSLAGAIPVAMRPANDILLPVVVSIGGVASPTWHCLIGSGGALILRVNSVAMGIGTAYIVSPAVVEYDASTLIIY